MLSMDRIDNISTKYKQKFPTLDIKYNLNDVANFQEDLSSDENDKSSPIITKKKLFSYKTYSSKNEIFYCCRFDPEDKLVAAGSSTGLIHILKIHEFISPVIEEPLYKLNLSSSAVTSLRWKKTQSSQKNILLSASADGKIAQYDISTSDKIDEIFEENNRNLCLDYNAGASIFATGGKDKIVRIYDDETKKVIHKFSNIVWVSSGHTNRIFSVKFHPENHNILASGGWDKSIFLWDLRSEKLIDSIYGPTVAGDSLDMKENLILTGSHRNHDQLELWDFSTRRKVEGIDWEYGYPRENSYVNTCQFSKANNESIVAGCSRINEVVFYDRRDQNKDFAKIDNKRSGVFCADFANNSDLYCFCGGNDLVRLGKIIPDDKL